MRELADAVSEHGTREPHVEFEEEKVEKENIGISLDFVVGEESGACSGYLSLHEQPEFHQHLVHTVRNPVSLRP